MAAQASEPTVGQDGTQGDTAPGSAQGGGEHRPRAVLIVGAGRRLGAAIARRFARDDRPIGLISRSAAALEALAAPLRDGGASVAWEAADAGDAAALRAAIATLAQRLGAFDVAIHNVATGAEVGAGDLTASQLTAEFAAGAASLLTLSRAVVDEMARAGRGTIIATGSPMADIASPIARSLSMQKAGLRLLVEVLAPTLADRGVHCALLTIRGMLAEGTVFDPDRVADAYADLVAQTDSERATWQSARTYGG